MTEVAALDFLLCVYNVFYGRRTSWATGGLVGKYFRAPIVSHVAAIAMVNLP